MGAERAMARSGRRTRTQAHRAERGAWMAEMQRSRLLIAAAGAVYELGYEEASVAQITDRAGVSRRTFYELFENREVCMLAVFESAVAQVEETIAANAIAPGPWRGRMRHGLWTILCFLDREPALARLCVVDALGAGEALRAARRSLQARLVAAVDEGRSAGKSAADCPRLVAEGVVGGVLGVLYERLADREAYKPLRGLLPDLMALVVQPYLGAAAARRERTRPVPGAIEPLGGVGSRCEDSPLRNLPMRLTYRTAQVLEAVAAHPRISNREAADHAGIQDQGQVSKLLGRLERLGLLANSGEHPKGEANAWTLTAAGREITRCISAHVQG